MEPIVALWHPPSAATVPCRASTSRRTFAGALTPALAAALAIVLGAALLPPEAGAAEVGDDGLHEQAWFVDSFRDVAEDMELAAAEGRRVLILYEQSGCPYCAKLHATLLDDPAVRDAVRERFDVVQYDLLGTTEVTDIDGTILTEASAAERWGVRFTPTMLFLPDPATLGDGGAPATARDVAVDMVAGVPDSEAFLTLLDAMSGDSPSD